MPRYLNPNGRYNLSLIMRDAWTKARGMAERARAAPIVSWRRDTTAQREFAHALKMVWDLARQERGYGAWAADQAAEKALAQALPARDRAIAQARTALLLAEHSDSLGSHALVSAARTRLATLTAQGPTLNH